MSAPRIISVWFGDGQYPALARVLEATAREHCPGWEIEVRRIDPPTRRAADGSASAAANAHKLEHWSAAVETAPDDARLLLLDADTFIVAPLGDLWAHEFDVAYTVRARTSRLPLNAGVIAARVNARTRAFFRAWVDQDARFLADVAARAPWRKRYGGHNQASLGATLGAPVARETHLLTLPCALWNCEDDGWANYGPHVRIVHVKSALRMACFGIATSARVRPLASMWRRLAEKT